MKLKDLKPYISTDLLFVDYTNSKGVKCRQKFDNYISIDNACELFGDYNIEQISPGSHCIIIRMEGNIPI